MSKLMKQTKIKNQVENQIKRCVCVVCVLGVWVVVGVCVCVGWVGGRLCTALSSFWAVGYTRIPLQASRGKKNIFRPAPSPS